MGSHLRSKIMIIGAGAALATMAFAAQAGTYPARPAGTYSQPVEVVNSAGDPAPAGTAVDPIHTTSTTLATGAATSAKQDTGNTSLGTIATNTTGLATAANQTTANSTLSTIATNTAALSIAETTGYISASGVSSTQTGADVVNTRYKGVVVFVDITAISGATVTCTISQKSPTGNYITVLAGAGETTVVNRAYSVYPGFTSVANSKGDYYLPKTWRMACVVSGGTTSFTVSYQLLP